MSSTKENCIQMMKEAVRSFRIPELKASLNMLNIPTKVTRKAHLLEMVLDCIDNFRDDQQNIPTDFLMQIYEFQRQIKNNVKGKNTSRASETNSSMPDKISPFFETICVLKLDSIKTKLVIEVEIPNKYFPLFRRKISKNARFSYELQLLFEYLNKEWDYPIFEIKLNEEVVKQVFESSQIHYVTSYCVFLKYKTNTIELAFAFNSEDIKVTLAIVKRYNPCQLLKKYPVTEDANMKELLLKYFNDNSCHVYEVTLFCPIEKRLMQYPCRSTLCSHPDVFDLMSFLDKMQYVLKWRCPVCQKNITFQSLRMDSYMCDNMRSGRLMYTFYGRSVLPVQSFPSSTEIIVIDD